MMASQIVYIKLITNLQYFIKVQTEQTSNVFETQMITIEIFVHCPQMTFHVTLT